MITLDVSALFSVGALHELLGEDGGYLARGFARARGEGGIYVARGLSELEGRSVVILPGALADTVGRRWVRA